jgi:hypothetical protein
MQYGLIPVSSLHVNDRTKEYPKAFDIEKGSDGSLLVLQRAQP